MARCVISEYPAMIDDYKISQIPSNTPLYFLDYLAIVCDDTMGTWTGYDQQKHNFVCRVKQVLHEHLERAWWHIPFAADDNSDPATEEDWCDRRSRLCARYSAYVPSTESELVALLEEHGQIKSKDDRTWANAIWLNYYCWCGSIERYRAWRHKEEMRVLRRAVS